MCWISLDVFSDPSASKSWQVALRWEVWKMHPAWLVATCARFQPTSVFKLGWKFAQGSPGRLVVYNDHSMSLARSRKGWQVYGIIWSHVKTSQAFLDGAKPRWSSLGYIMLPHYLVTSFTASLSFLKVSSSSRKAGSQSARLLLLCHLHLPIIRKVCEDLWSVPSKGPFPNLIAFELMGTNCPQAGWPQSTLVASTSTSCPSYYEQERRDKKCDWHDVSVPTPLRQVVIEFLQKSTTGHNKTPNERRISKLPNATFVTKEQVPRSTKTMLMSRTWCED